MLVSEYVSINSIKNFFGNREFSEIHLDVGCGTGDFLISAANQHADIACIGLDINQETVRILKKKLDQRNLLNATVANHEAANFIKNYVKVGSIAGIHVYFPTPYIKPLNQSPEINVKIDTLLLVHEFLSQCKRALRPGGTLRIVTDHLAYIKRARKFAFQAGFHEVPWTGLVHCADVRHIVGTGWEKETLRRGQTVYTLKFI